MYRPDISRPDPFSPFSPPFPAPPRSVPPSGSRSVTRRVLLPCCPAQGRSFFGIFLAIVYLIGYMKRMIEVRQTEVFTQWFDRLRDRQVRARINVRIRRLSLGNFGDAKPVGEGVSELRIDFGPGYRVYFVRRGRTLVVLLAGGDKHSQDRDIKKAQKLAREL